MQHYLTAAAEGNAVAEFRIGYLYEHGWGVRPISPRRARGMPRPKRMAMRKRRCAGRI